MNTKLMNTAGLRAHTLSLAVAAATAAMASGTASAEEWQWAVTPYVWTTDLGVGLAVADREIVDTEIAFDDLVEKIDGAAMVRVEGKRGEHGMAFDVFNVELIDTYVVELPAAGADLSLDVGVGLTIVDASGVYDPRGDGKGFSLVYGTRVIEQRNDLDAALRHDGMTAVSHSLKTTDRFVDGLVGFRYVRELPHDFSYGFAADVSTGGTELTWSAGPAIGYTFGERDQYRVTAGYRRMDIDFETAEPVEADMSMSGLLIGFRLNF